MTVALVWFAVRGVHPDDFLARAGFVDTGEVDEYFEAPVSGCDHAGGWYIMLADDVSLLDVDYLKEWSEGAQIVAVAVKEDSLFALATEWRDGKPVWSISHEADDEGEPLVALEGEMPEVFEPVRRQYLEAQDGATPAELAFEAPLEVAFRITGFRYDTLGFEDGCVFSVLETA